jgi:uncharacterized protein YndB with AHSA1/START domain
MNQLHFSTDINAPRESVWKVLWDDATYREWTSVFAEGSYAVSDWNEGSKIQFIDPASRSGMAAVIEKKRPHELMSFRHVAEIKDGKEEPPAKWAGAHENYTLAARDGRTILSVDLDAPEEYRPMFEDKFPKALELVKALSEKA